MRVRPEDYESPPGRGFWFPHNQCPDCGADQTVMLHWETCQSQDWEPPTHIRLETGITDTGYYHDAGSERKRFAQDGVITPEFEVPLPSDLSYTFMVETEFNPYLRHDEITVTAPTERTTTFVAVDAVLKPGRYAVVLLEPFEEDEPEDIQP